MDRRTLLIGGGAAVGLVLAWELWPRTYSPNLAAGPGETVMGAFLKIGADSRVTVVVPQTEMGQGIWTALPQALADELGADWRQVGVEPAPVNPLYANRLIAGDYGAEHVPHFLTGVGAWAARQWATRNALMVTGGSTSVRAFEQPFREAGATARALLCMAAAKRLGVDWRACDTDAGFVVRGDDRFRFGDLAAEAARHAPPAVPPLRRPGEGAISGRAMPRLDVPSKIDGTARFAGDVRLPGMIYASIRHGPVGDTRLAGQDMPAADRQAGVLGVVRGDGWLAALANNWWAADRALDHMQPRFATTGTPPDSAAVARALDAALAAGGTLLTRVGKPDAVLSGPGLVEATYDVPFAPHATIEPLVATARMEGDRLEVWMPTQAPGLARDAIAAATGVGAGSIILYPTLAGGSSGRKLENDAAIQAAILAIHAKKPVQLMWSRTQEMLQGRHRPPARARLSARLSAQGQIAAWRTRIAVPATMGETVARLVPGHGGAGAETAAVDGAVPPYAIPALTVEHAPAAIGIATGPWRSAAHSYTAFFTECFVDELAQVAGQDPLAFRMGLLAHNPRLARCLAQAAASGGWTGEAGSGEGLAAHSAFGSHVALYAAASNEGSHSRVSRLVAVVDAGRLINPDIARQQVEGALLWGLGSVLGGAVTYAHGLPQQSGFDALGLPRLADTPDIRVEFIRSAEAPGGLTDLAEPVTAPAVANALFSATSHRLRSLPLSL